METVSHGNSNSPAREEINVRMKRFIVVDLSWSPCSEQNRKLVNPKALKLWTL